MNRRFAWESWRKFAIGGALAIFPMLIFYVLYGSGPTFPPVQLYTWPVSIIGGIIVGYAVAELVVSGDRRFPGIGFALMGGTIAWTGQLVIQSSVNPAVTFTLTDVVDYRIGLAIAIFIVAIVEGMAVLNRRRSTTR